MEHKIHNKKTFILLGIVISFCFILLYLKSLPASFAWFHADSSATGEIVNATTANLLEIGSVQTDYLEDGTVKSTLSIKNISNISIPVKAEFLLNQEVIGISTILLEPDGTFSPDFEAVKLNDGAENDLKIRVIGFNQYIDEIITLRVKKVTIYLKFLK
jgi:hypothetical protein